MSYTNLSSHHGLGEVGRISPVLEQDAVRQFFHRNEYPQFGLISSEEIKSLIQRYGTENSASTRLDTLHCVRNVADCDQSPIGDGSLCSMISQAPICREFWKAGKYDDIYVSKPTTQYGTGHLHIHPKFLHSNATSHKWVFGAMAELIDNAVDEDIYLSGGRSNAKNSSTKEASEHLANRIHYSLCAYLSILYLQILKNFQIILSGRGVEYHSIANDLKFPEFVLYKPQNVEGSVLTTIGFLKEAPDVTIHGFNVYHKNRLILPFWCVVTYSRSRGRGVVEANFVEPTHNKQDFEKTPVFLKLETRLKEMTQEYWDYHCGLIGYQVTKKPWPNTTSYTASNSAQSNGIYQPVVLVGGFSNATGAKVRSAAGSTKWHANTSSNNVAGKPKSSMTPHNLCSEVCSVRLLKREGCDCDIEPERLKRTGDIGSTIYSAHGEDHAVDHAKLVEDHKAANIIQENERLRAQCQQYEKLDEELYIMATQLAQEEQEAQREYARLLLELRHLEKVKQCNRQVQPGQHYL